MKKFTKQEVAQHNKDTDCWIIINYNVYDITKFLNLHPVSNYSFIKREEKKF